MTLKSQRWGNDLNVKYIPLKGNHFTIDRLFGNLCYESGAGRSLVITSGIIPVMLTSLRNRVAKNLTKF